MERNEVSIRRHDVKLQLVIILCTLTEHLVTNLQAMLFEELILSVDP